MPEGNDIESRLRAAAAELRTNSELKASEFSVPVLALIFLRCADHKSTAAERELAAGGSGRRKPGPAGYRARGVLYVPEEARFSAPTAVVKLIVDVIEPFHSRVHDPACGSGGTLVQSARFVAEHKTAR